MKPGETELAMRFMPMSEFDYGDHERRVRKQFLETAKLVVEQATAGRSLSVALTELEGAMLWAINAI